MNKFDKYLRKKAADENFEVPDSVKEHIESVLMNLPDEKENSMRENARGKASKRRSFYVLTCVAAAVCFIFLTVFLLPSVSPAYAEVLVKIPVIGDIVKVVTKYGYSYTDDRYKMEVDVPQIDDENNDAAEYINKSVEELTSQLVEEFYKDLEKTDGEGYKSVYVDYETVTNTDKWFTLKLSVYNGGAGTGNQYYKYYHIDKRSGNIVQLGDLFESDDYSDIIAEEIKRQMQEQMDNDENISYWINGALPGADFVSLDSGHNFYWNENGELVIVFDKYEVAPGVMGTPEFAIGKDIIENIIKPEFADIIQ